MPAAGIAPSAGGKEYPGELTLFVTVTCVVAAMGGLIFGYDIGISGGVTTMATFLEKFFPSVYRKQEADKSTNQYCKFDSQTLTMFTSSLYLAALLSSMVASTITRKFGRKLSMLFGGILFFAGALINAFAKDIAMLIVGRILLGFGVGFANQIHWGWRLSLGGAMVPALVITVGALVLPDTPNSLIERGQLDKARANLRRVRGVEDVDEELNDLIAASEASAKVEHPWRNLLQRKYRPHLTMAILIPFFQQFTGINVIMFYAPVLFKTIGFTSDASLMSAVITGLVNVIATTVSIYGVDKWGRRALFLEGGSQMLICQVIIAIFIGVKFGINGEPGNVPKWYAVVVVLFICIYVAAFAWSWGPLGWLVPSEIFPLEIRSAAQSINVSTNMLFTFVVAQVFLMLLCNLKFGLFLFFAFFVIVMTIFVYFFLPETKGIPIEEMSLVWKRHPFWGKFVLDDDLPPSVIAANLELGKTGSFAKAL